MFLSVRNILCPQQIFPSLRSPRNIMGNNVSATMFPHLPGPQRHLYIRKQINLSTFIPEKGSNCCVLYA